MRNRNIIKLFIAFIAIFLVFSSNKVEANEKLTSTNATDIAGNVVGSITLYDDYTVSFTYVYRVKDIEITVCKKGNCDNAEPQISYNVSYTNGELANFSISEYLVSESKQVTYTVIASGDFKTSETSTSQNKVTLTTNIIVKAKASEDDTSSGDALYDNSVNKVQKVFNEWVIPGIYLVLAVTLVVKAILLSIDLIKYSDNSIVRKEKIRAFTYLFIALLAIAIINSSIGFITGLFD
jgi:hypothetical protein